MVSTADKSADAVLLRDKNTVSWLISSSEQGDDLISIFIGLHPPYLICDLDLWPHSYKLEQLASRDDIEFDSYKHWVLLQKLEQLASRLEMI
jgi:hypothetical protein